MNSHYTYLLLNIASVFFPFILSFDKKVAFYKTWKTLFPSMFIVGLFFILWDMFFTKQGVWAFNEQYILGIYIYNLPIEEILFFITVPYACVFIYEVLNAYVSKDYLQRWSMLLSIVIATSLFITLLFNYDKAYTALNFSVGLCLIIYIQFIKKWQGIGRFYLAYFVTLLPFMICNGVLTYLPVVIYNNNENLGLRITTIPIEDTIYSFSLLLGNVFFMRYFQAKKKGSLN